MGSPLRLLRSMSRSEAPAEPRSVDDPLIARARAGDVEAWSRLYQEHFDAVYRHVAYLVGERHATEDIVQETFALAVVGLAGFTGRSSFVAWLRGIALNLSRRHWRSHKRGERARDHLERQLGEPGHGHGSPEEHYLRRRRVEALMTALDGLPAPLREAYVLSDLREMSPAEAAAELGITVNNLRVRATRARTRVREELARLGWRIDGPERREEPAP